ncbi:MAG: hypothetical protein NVSMB5_25040 [Candidatus Velthaea sp.]
MNKLRAIFIRDMQLALTNRMSLVLQFVSIAIAVTGMAYISRLVPPSTVLGENGRSSTYFSYVVINTAFVLFQSTALLSFAGSIRNDQLMGTLESIHSTPTSLPLLVLASNLWAFTVTFAQVAFYLVFARAAFGLHLGATNLVSASVFALLTVATMSSLGVLSAASVMVFKQRGPTNLLVGGAASLLGGVLFPIAFLPQPVQVISWLLPITHTLRGMRGAIAGASLDRLMPDAVWLTIVAIALFPLSLLAFRYAVDKAKFDGTLANY